MSGIFLGDKPTKTTAVVNADEIPLLDSQDLSSGRKKVKKVTATNLKSSIGGVQSIVAGSGVSVDNTDPANPIVSASGGAEPLVYVAKIGQSGTNPPTQQVIFNNIGATLSFAYEEDGSYFGSFSQPIDLSKAVGSLSPNSQLSTLAIVQITEGQLRLEVGLFNGIRITPSNDLLAIENSILKIEIYP